MDGPIELLSTGTDLGPMVGLSGDGHFTLFEEPRPLSLSADPLNDIQELHISLASLESTKSDCPIGRSSRALTHAARSSRCSGCDEEMKEENVRMNSMDEDGRELYWHGGCLKTYHVCNPYRTSGVRRDAD